jgi:lipopolysaccharide/colanic/teichoic acid biosynthesis glycosyltransferase
LLPAQNSGGSSLSDDIHSNTNCNRFYPSLRICNAGDKQRLGENCLNADLHVTLAFPDQAIEPPAQSRAPGVAAPELPGNPASAARHSRSLCGKTLSPWSLSGGKRLFDCVCVLLVLPLLVPALLAIALVVCLTSSGSVLFLQQRMGRHGRPFTIAKFRTLVHSAGIAHHAVTTADNQRFTPVGPFLRRWKLDELPQLLNVLAGDMSLVGPRPKLKQHVISVLPCRPGITGAATIAFACEEVVLDRVPPHRLEACYHSVVLPAKRMLDAEYMARATFLSDLKLLAGTVLRRWDSSVMETLLHTGAFDAQIRLQLNQASQASVAADASARMPLPRGMDCPAAVEQVAAF